jgi:hypothetical protein
MKLQIACEPDVSNDYYKRLTFKELDEFADMMVSNVRGPIDFHDICDIKRRLDDMKFRDVSQEFKEFLTADRWTEYIKAFVEEVVYCEFASEPSNIHESIVLTYGSTMVPIIHVEFPEDFLKEEYRDDAKKLIIEGLYDSHEKIVEKLWAGSKVGMFSILCIAVLE